MSMPRLPAQLMVKTPDITIYGGEAENYEERERIDWVVTNPYGPIPSFLSRCPMLIHQWHDRQKTTEAWIHRPMHGLVSTWNHGQEAWWTVNTNTLSLDLSTFVPEPIGWMPYAMVHRLLMAYVTPGQTIWDGFMGRGTIAKAARDLGMKYVGVELLAKHVAFARTYLGV